MSRQSRLRGNILWNYASGFVSVFGLLLLYPLAVAASGGEEYGLWVLAFGAIQFFSMMDFGLGTAIVRRLGHIGWADDARLDRRRFVTLGITLFVLLASLLTAMFGIGLGVYYGTVSIPVDIAPVLPIVVAAASVDLWFTVLGRAANSVLWAEDRPDIERKAAIVAILLRAVGLGAVLISDHGLLGVVVVESVTLVLPSVVCLVAVSRRYGRPVFSTAAMHQHAAPLVTMSWPLFIGSMAGLAATQLPLFLVGSHLGLLQATAFGALLRVYQSGRLAISWLTNPFSGQVADSETNGPQLEVLFRQCTRLAIGVGAALSISITVMAQPILSAWLGPQFVFAGSALAVIGLGIMVNAILFPAALFVNLRGNPWVIARLQLVALMLTVPAVILAVDTGELTWIAVAMVGPSAALVPLFVLAVRRLGLTHFDRSDLKRIGVFTASAAILAAIGLSLNLAGSAWVALTAYAVTVLAAGVIFFASRRHRRTLEIRRMDQQTRP
ncbi:lipopolysaccharide biosynthesis protein [Agromyces sp. NPDC056523]|uniref:lipopolysaccharide biosynthesis protein n=1 Tax=Agromyces sp. NPDC056523 TaxID=3345850 RepID=UPI00367174F3